ncbi:hypothetical protein MNBD_GAMMA12-3864 [hydrothermal vent metagenome]|uniref:Uncharacterized protein n=1 Tax=hydrothermal vent metagenome TaxID=652676 RepID=A0A3B0YUJ6_9ZZZZ
MFNLNYVDEQLQIPRESTKTGKVTSAALFFICTVALLLMFQSSVHGFDSRIILLPAAIISLYVATWRNIMVIDASKGIIEIRRGFIYPTFVITYRLCDFDRLVIRYHVFKKSRKLMNDLLNPNKHYYLCLVGHDKNFVEIDYFSDMRIAQLRAKKIANYAGLIYDQKAYPIED